MKSFAAPFHLLLIFLHLSTVFVGGSTTGTYSHNKQSRLSAAINETLASSNLSYPFPSTREQKSYSNSSFIVSSFSELCSKLPEKEIERRIGCCQPLDTRYLYNVMFGKGKIIMFTGEKGADIFKSSKEAPVVGTPSTSSGPSISSQGKGSNHLLPPVRSIRLQVESKFNVDIETRTGPLPLSQCKEYFDGTLHVVGRSTVKNVYHALADNFIPMAAQIMLDAFLAPDFLHKPRMMLTGFYPGGDEGVLHMQLLTDLMSAGTISVDKVKDMCFRRVVWGHGAHVMFYDVRVSLRRLLGDFAHHFVNHMYDLHVPAPFNKHKQHAESSKRRMTLSQQTNDYLNRRILSQNSSMVNSNDTSLLSNPTNVNITQMSKNLPPQVNGTIDNSVTTNNQYIGSYSMNGTSTYNGPRNKMLYRNQQPLKIVIYTRGSTGKGRSIQGEEHLVKALQDAGALVSLCCDYSKATLVDQISYAYHADVVMGLHGAALAHTLFQKRGSLSLELKTLYGYTSILFALVADSRVGTHAQIDIRDYFIPGGHKPIDSSLINRTITALYEAILFQYNNIIGNIKVLPSKEGDLIVGPSSQIETMNNVLGPPQDVLLPQCKAMVFHRLRNQLDHTRNEVEFHCALCAPFRRRMSVIDEDIYNDEDIGFMSY